MRYALVVLAACGGDPQTASDAANARDATLVDATPPAAAGCITDVSPGDHTFTCGGLQTDVRIPAACEAPGCGLILELHGDTGNGLLMDGHTNLRALGEQHGYIVVAPSGPPWPGGPGSTWHSSNDATLIAITTQVRDVFRVDPNKIHVTGFSRGSFVTWRLLCDHAELFASAAPGGGDGTDFGEVTCFSNNRVPSRKLPILFLMGQLDQAVGYPSLVQIRDAAIASYGLANHSTISSDTTYHHDRWSGTDSTTVIETFDHGYATVPDGPFGSAQGHCIAGSTSDPYAVQYAIPCKLPNSFVWGEEVMSFFLAHPMS